MKAFASTTPSNVVSHSVPSTDSAVVLVLANSELAGPVFWLRWGGQCMRGHVGAIVLTCLGSHYAAWTPG